MAEVVSIRKDTESNTHPLAVAITGKVLRITLDNPPSNTLSLALLQSLMDALEAAEANEAVSVVIIASTGNVFSAGHDLKELSARREDPDEGRAFFDKTFRLGADLMMKISAMSKPVIAEIDGLATAAGCQLVAACDLAICTDTSTFCTPGVNIGLFCAGPMVALSRAAHRKQAMEMLLTGETIDASTAKDFGLVNRIVPRQYLTQVVEKYARAIASKSPDALRVGKQAFNRQAGMPLDRAYDDAVRVMTDSMLADDARKGIGAFLEDRMPDWNGD